MYGRLVKCFTLLHCKTVLSKAMDENKIMDKCYISINVHIYFKKKVILQSINWKTKRNNAQT